ncbi:hypothetical protein Glove_114g189 [Diversispora epigaea]|uniref:C2 domain-containing protein n=1 Tax=Diversispora epigaea TaxID=1348612 RepID=A0A397JBL2_9GLOM|nr:hypothetical protein Glove_114g189 [Diversispora epigaea]
MNNNRNDSRERQLIIMIEYFKKKFVEWGNIYKSIVTPSPELNSATAMEKQNFQDSYQDTLEHDQETPRSGPLSSDQSITAFDNIGKAFTGRFSVTIIEGRKIDVANYQSKPYCIVEFEQHEVVTKEAIKQYVTSIHSREAGKSTNFLDIVRASTNPIWKQEAVFDIIHLDGKVHVSIYERVSDQAQSEIFLGMLKIQPPRHPN